MDPALGKLGETSWKSPLVIPGQSRYVAPVVGIDRNTDCNTLTPSLIASAGL